MILGPFVNALYNPRFDMPDYGPGPFTVTGFVNNRWKFESSGAVGGVSVNPNGVTSSDAAVDKTWRGVPCLEVTVTAASYSAADTRIIRQRVPYSAQHTEMDHRFVMVAFGPVGGSFKAGFNGNYTTIQTLGPTVPVVSTPIRKMVPRISDEYLTVEVFREPADMDAVYQIVFAQHEYLVNAEAIPSPFERRDPNIERLHCARFLWPCPQWLPCLSTTTNQVVVPIVVPVEMRAVPVLVGGAASVMFVQTTNAAEFTSANPSPALSATHKSNRGGRVVLQNFTNPSPLGSGVVGMIGTERAFLLEAELG